MLGKKRRNKIVCDIGSNKKIPQEGTKRKLRYAGDGERKKTRSRSINEGSKTTTVKTPKKWVKVNL